MGKFDMDMPDRDTSEAHIVEVLDRFWNVRRLPPSTNAHASFDPIVAPCMLSLIGVSELADGFDDNGS